MSIVIATPMYGGNCTVEYADSLARTQAALALSGVPHRVITHHDSLVTRARNCLVARFMNDPELKEYEAFIFIDADIRFEPEDIAKLWNLGEPVAAACYHTKREDTKTTAWKDGQLVNLDDLEGPTEIDYAGTGFLMIRREVFEKMYEAFPETRHVEGKGADVYALFDCKVMDQDKPWEERWYCSEDYLFCHRWRELGGKIILDPSIRLGHVGRKVYE